MNHKRNFRDLNCVVLFEILSNFFFHFQNFTYRTSNQSHSVSIPNAVRLRMHFTFTFFLSKIKIISDELAQNLLLSKFTFLSQLFHNYFFHSRLELITARLLTNWIWKWQLWDLNTKINLISNGISFAVWDSVTWNNKISIQSRRNCFMAHKLSQCSTDHLNQKSVGW